MLERVAIFIRVMFRLQGGKQADPGLPDFLATIMIPNRVLQNSLEQHGQLLSRLVAVFFCQFDHGILNDVQRHVFVTHGKQRLFVGATFHSAEES